MDRYKALALQMICNAVNQVKTRAEAEAIMFKTIEHLDVLMFGSKTFIGQDTKLIVLPEYFLTGYPMGETLAAWRDKSCIAVGDQFYETLGKLAQKHSVYLSGNAYELDEHFPDLYFQTSFILDNTGNVILRYRRLNSMFAPTPHDVWDKYLDIYGYESLFPVAKTPIGNLACIASEEILYPEIARCLMMRGAEVFLHSSSEKGSPQMTRKNIAKAARAIENMAYVVSSNSGGIRDIAIPINSTDGNSKIINYDGLTLAEANQGESMVANATIDLAALRANRKRVAMSNYIARQRFEIYAPSYANHHFYPVNSISDNPNFVKKDFVRNQLATIQKLSENAVIQ